MLDREINILDGLGIMLVDTVKQENLIYIFPETNQVEVQYMIHESDQERLHTGIFKGMANLSSTRRFSLDRQSFAVHKARESAPVIRKEYEQQDLSPGCEISDEVIELWRYLYRLS